MRQLLRLQIVLLCLCFSLISFSQLIVPVTDCNLNGWVREPSFIGRSVNLTNGPGLPPYPIGSVEFSIGPNGNEGEEFTTGIYSGTMLWSITGLSYWTYLQNGTGGQTVYLILNVDVNGNGVFDLSEGDDQLTYDPAFQGGFTHQTIQANIWQQWNARNGGWWSFQGTGGAIDGPHSQPLSTILNFFPPSARLASGNSIRMVAGYSSPAWDNFLGNADAFTISIGSRPDSIYNFESCQGAFVDSDGDGVDDAHDCAPFDAHLSSPVTYYADRDNDGYGDPFNVINFCSLTPPPGYVTDHTDCNDKNDAVHPGATEVCNGMDDNCDGVVDEGFSPATFYQDADGDGYGNPAVTVLSCGPAPAGYVSNNGDCNDNNASIHPGATEICNGVDDDCDGLVDEGFSPNTYYKDADHDGYGNPDAPIKICGGLPPGYANNNSDCDDSNPAIHPGAVEICNGRDDNCDGSIDEGVGNTYYADADHDGFGDPNNVIKMCSAAPPPGYVTNNGDCDDNNAKINPKALEVCNGVDDNCNGLVDEGVSGKTFYQDADGDGYGNPARPISACTAPFGYVGDNTDCNDNNPDVHPGAAEICNGVDDNCNGQIDEGGTITFYKDADHDGFGDPNASVQACSAPPGYVSNNRDCNDANAAVHPGAIERCGDGIDNDCDGRIDNGLLPVADAGPDKTVYYAGPGNVYPGYPNCATVTASGSGGLGPYTYKWSTGATTQSITVCPTTTTTYTVTITGSNGCKNTDQVTVFVIDVRCGNKNDKVIVCHNGSENCISPGTVQSHLNHGDVLGACPATFTQAIKTNENKKALPLVYSLSNFPNPFSSATIIQYGLPANSKITLKLYDLMGREIRVLVSGDRKAGNYTIEMDGSKLATGVYYYRMIAVSALGETEKIEKMVIVR